MTPITAPNVHPRRLLWAGFTAILAAGTGFAVRGGILDNWGAEFGFSATQLGVISGAGFTGFCFGIFVGGLIVDQLGFGKLIVASFCLHVISAVVTLTASATDMSSRQETYVIVHGAWGAGYEWKEVGRQLRVEGCDVYRPTLTGMGERSHLADPEINLETHILDVVNTILFEDLHDVILVGHSCGGMVITGAADRVPDRLQRVVYVDAFLPENGESLNRPGEGLSATDGFVHPPWNPPPSPPPHVVPQPAKTFSQPIVLTNQEAVAKIPATYILTVDSGKNPEADGFFRFSERARERDWKVIMMESDHIPQMSQPTEITRLLLLQK